MAAHLRKPGPVLSGRTNDTIMVLLKRSVGPGRDRPVPSCSSDALRIQLFATYSKDKKIRIFLDHYGRFIKKSKQRKKRSSLEESASAQLSTSILRGQTSSFVFQRFDFFLFILVTKQKDELRVSWFPRRPCSVQSLVRRGALAPPPGCSEFSR